MGGPLCSFPEPPTPGFQLLAAGSPATPHGPSEFVQTHPPVPATLDVTLGAMGDIGETPARRAKPQTSRRSWNAHE